MMLLLLMDIIINFFNMYKKILFSILISVLAVKIFSPIVFLANTPRMNPRFIASLIEAPEKIISFPGKMIAGLSNMFIFQKNTDNYNQNYNNQIANQPVSFITPPPYLQFKPVSKYVEAAEDEKEKKTYLKIKKGARLKVVGTVEINGKTYPKVEIVEE